MRSAQEPEVLFRHRVPTGADQGYAHILGQLALLVQHMEAAAGYRAAKLGIGTPGTTIPKIGLMKSCNATVLMGMEVTLANAANCFALAETRLGIVKQQFLAAKVVFGIVLGTGVGGGWW